MAKFSKKILLINNRTHFIEDLKKALADHEVECVDFMEADPESVAEFDCVVLSGGGSAGEVADGKRLYKNEIDIIRKSGKPVFGICEGFQVIGAAFGSDFRVLPQYRESVNEVRVLVRDPIFGGMGRFDLKGFEFHHIAVKRAGDELQPLAISDDGIEVMKHKDRLIYASQFHPEELAEGNNGHILLQNFLARV